MRTSHSLATLSLCLAISAAWAQQAPTAATTFSSQAGRVSATETVKASVLVTAIDRGSRTLTVKSADGATDKIVAGPEVRNFDQIAVNDQVAVQYKRTLTLQLRSGGGMRQSTESVDATRAAKGDKPGAAVAGHVTVMADVIDVNPKEKTISLRGPKGKVMVLDVENPDQFKVVKKGDQVEADYTETLAVSVVKAPTK